MNDFKTLAEAIFMVEVGEINENEMLDYMDAEDEIELSYKEKRDEDVIDCACCGDPLLMKRIKYIHRHDGANEIEYYMGIDKAKTQTINGQYYCMRCDIVRLDVNYGKVEGSKYKCMDDRDCVYKVGEFIGSDTCPVSCNEDAPVLCHFMVEKE